MKQREHIEAALQLFHEEFVRAEEEGNHQHAQNLGVAISTLAWVLEIGDQASNPTQQAIQGILTDIGVAAINHPAEQLATHYLREAARKGGRAKSEAKVNAARNNGAKGGRPKRQPAEDILETVLADEARVGTPEYKGIAYFWHYDFRHYLRDAKPAQRRKVHKQFLASGLELDGYSAEHEAIVRANTQTSVSDD